MFTIFYPEGTEHGNEPMLKAHYPSLEEAIADLMDYWHDGNELDFTNPESVKVDGKEAARIRNIEEKAERPFMQMVTLTSGNVDGSSNGIGLYNGMHGPDAQFIYDSMRASLERTCKSDVTYFERIGEDATSYTIRNEDNSTLQVTWKFEPYGK